MCAILRCMKDRFNRKDIVTGVNTAMAAVLLFGVLAMPGLARAKKVEGTMPPPGQPEVTCDTQETPMPWKGPFKVIPHYGYSPIMAAAEAAWANQELGMTAQVYGCNKNGNIVFEGPVQNISTPNGEPAGIGLQMPRTGKNGELIVKYLNVYEVDECEGAPRQFVDVVTTADMDLTNQLSLPQAQK